MTVEFLAAGCGRSPILLAAFAFCFLESQAQTFLPTFSVKAAHFRGHKHSLNKRSLLDGAGIFSCAWVYVWSMHPLILGF